MTRVLFLPKIGHAVGLFTQSLRAVVRSDLGQCVSGPRVPRHHRADGRHCSRSCLSGLCRRDAAIREGGS